MPESVVPVPPNFADPRLSLADAVAEGSPVGQWADYIVARTVHDRRNGVPHVVTEFLRSFRISPTSNRGRFVIGVLEATGVLAPYPMREGATYDQMRRAVGLVAGKLKASEPLALPEVAGAVVGALSPSAGAWRLLGWATGAMLLHPRPDGARHQMKNQVVELGRQAQRRGQVPDVEGFARSVFAVAATAEVTEHQKFLVAGWLSGEEVPWEPVAGTEVTPGPAVPGRQVTSGRDVVGADHVDGVMSLDESVSLRERAEYVVHRAVLAVAADQHVLHQKALAAEVFGVGQSYYEWGVVAGFVQGAGLGSLLHQNATDTSQHMAGVFAAARRSLEEGKTVDPLAITTSILGRAPHNYDRFLLGRVTGWLTVAGLMGGPVVKDGVIERIKGALTGA
ncbi:hypothetical protein ACFU51_38090, partial [Streptomyces sp. NPDC057430]|uniref:hypothetical protein n=1 Tax=Streptomyces sp. NPDC057430 TaxID=3346131 RepID=UPI0036763EFD